MPSCLEVHCGVQRLQAPQGAALQHAAADTYVLCVRHTCRCLRLIDVDRDHRCRDVVSGSWLVSRMCKGLLREALRPEATAGKRLFGWAQVATHGLLNVVAAPHLAVSSTYRALDPNLPRPTGEKVCAESAPPGLKARGGLYFRSQNPKCALQKSMLTGQAS